MTDGGRDVVAATLRTPPHNQVLSCVDELEAVDALVDALRDEDLPGLLGPTEPAARFAAPLDRCHGRSRRASRSPNASSACNASSLPSARRPAGGGWWGHETAS